MVTRETCYVSNFPTTGFYQNLDAGFKIIKNVKILCFKGEWKQFLQKIWFYRKSGTKYFTKSKTITSLVQSQETLISVFV